MEEKAIKIKIKPFSVNKAWKGVRYRTDDYKRFEMFASYELPNDYKIPEGKKLRGIFIWGMSNMQGDEDNPRKPFQDVLQKKYGFNDSQIHESFMKKVKVPKGEEFIEFWFEEILEDDFYYPQFRK